MRNHKLQPQAGQNMSRYVTVALQKGKAMERQLQAGPDEFSA